MIIFLVWAFVRVFSLAYGLGLFLLFSMSRTAAMQFSSLITSSKQPFFLFGTGFPLSPARRFGCFRPTMPRPCGVIFAKGQGPFALCAVSRAIKRWRAEMFQFEFDAELFQLP